MFCGPVTVSGTVNRKGSRMDFDDIATGIQLLLQEMEERPADKHELLEKIHSELNRLKATGQPLPEDLELLEKRLEEEMTVKPEAGKN